MCEPFHTSLVVQKMQRGKKNPHGDEKAPTIKGRGKLSRAGQRYNSALPALQDTGPNLSWYLRLRSGVLFICAKDLFVGAKHAATDGRA